MKITKRQLRRIIEGYNSMSPAGKSLAVRAKRLFGKDYPEVVVKINAVDGWVEVEGRKAVNMSSASGRPMSLEDVIDKMKQAYLGHPMQETKIKITKRQLRRIIQNTITEVRIADSGDTSGSSIGEEALAITYVRDYYLGLKRPFLDWIGGSFRSEDYDMYESLIESLFLAYELLDRAQNRAIAKGIEEAGGPPPMKNGMKDRSAHEWHMRFRDEINAVGSQARADARGPGSPSEKADKLFEYLSVGTPVGMSFEAAIEGNKTHDWAARSLAQDTISGWTKTIDKPNVVHGYDAGGIELRPLKDIPGW